VSGERRKARRSYLPTVEALEALRLFSGAAPTLPDVAGIVAPIEATPASPSSQASAWDAALGQSSVSALLAPPQGRGQTDPATFAAGFDQLNRYLARAWGRAGIAPQKWDDATQAVYVTLLENLGRARFDALVGDVGRSGIRDVLSRETPEGPDFFRAIDTVKKRAQRERSFQPLERAGAVAVAAADSGPSQWRDALQEAIDRTLNPRETALVQETLLGKTPAEIARDWGVAPKTVSNEKTRAFQKLRDFLIADLVD
jgi:DNA-binding CsgD family transcriptional regulator